MDFKDRNCRVLSFTHTDLDGAGCQVILRNIYENIDCQCITYGQLEKKCFEWASCADVKNNYDVIMFTDYYPDKMLDWKSFGVPIVVIDHHETSVIHNDPSKDIYIRTDYCGTYLTQFIMQHYFPDVDLSMYDEFVTLVNDHDMGIHKDVRSLFFSNLYFEYGDHHKFVNRRIISPIDLDDEEMYMVEKISKEFEEVYNETELFELPGNGVYLEAHKYLSDFTIRLLETYEYIVFDYSPTKYCLRSKEIDLSKVCKLMNNGGGHKLAAGMDKVEGKDQCEFMMELVETINKVKEEG
jgi:hypothetical protein